MKKKWKKGLYLLGVLLAVTGTVGCQQQSKAEKEPEKAELKIGVSVYDQFDTFVASMVNHMQEYAKEKEKEWGMTITLEIKNANKNQMTQNDQLDDFINRGFDVTCINLVDRTDASTIIDKAKNADVPVIFFNRELVEEDLQRWDRLYYVGADAFLSGEIQGEILLEQWRKDPKSIDKNEDGVLQCVILEGEPGHNDSLVRTMSVISVLTEGGIQVEKLADDIANWNRSEAETKMNQLIPRFGDQIEVVLSNNDDMALGALDSLKKNQVTNMPVILGIDGTEMGLQAVENGEMLGTVLNDARGQAEGALELAYSIATGEPLSKEVPLREEKYVRYPYEKVTSQNVAQIQLATTGN